MTTATHAVRPRGAPPETQRRAANEHAAAAGTPRYLRPSLKLGGLHDPEEREAEHAAGVIASGGRYKAKDPGGSEHLRAEPESAHQDTAHVRGAASVRTMHLSPDGSARREPDRPAHTPGHVRAAVVPSVVDPGAAGRVRRAMADAPAHTAGADHVRPAVAEPVVDPGAGGRVRRAMAPRVHDPGGSASLRAMHMKDEVRSAAAALPPLKHDVADSAVASRIEHARAGAARPLPATVRARLEHGFAESMENVRIHTGPAAHAAAFGIHARAYTEGERITLGRGESEHDVRLLAHEATHVVQNRRAAGVPRMLPAGAREARREPAAKPHGEVRAEPIKTAAEPGPIRRVGLDSVLNAFADLANAIPGFRLFTIILGLNPITMARVDRSGANILRAAVEIIPGGNLIVRALDSYGVFDKAGTWVEQQIATLKMTGEAIRDALVTFIKSLGLGDVFHPGDVWDRAKKIFTEPIDRIIAFLKALADGIIALIKDAVLRPLAALAAKTRAWDLLIALLGKNPITNEEVPQTPEVLIGGFMKLAGEEEVWENMKKANAINRAFAWFKDAMATLLAFAQQIPTLFIDALKSLKIEDLLDLPGTFLRIAGTFGDFAGKFFGWAAKAVWNLLEIIFDVVSPGALVYIKKTGAALKSILKDPLPFVRNLVAAAKLGLNNFMDNFGEHLKAGLLDWLTGSLPGVYIPKALSLAELGKFALSVLGISWPQIRGKIVKALGPNGERIMKALETAFDIVVALVKGGPAAAWDLIKEKLTNLKDMVIDGIVSFVTETIIKKAIPKLISMFIPGAGFISAILSIYDTVMVFVQKLAKIAAAVMAFVDSIIAIAAGQIAGAAARVEAGLAGLLSLAISFLAGFLGLGNVAEKIMGVIQKVRAFIDKALDTAINFIIGKAKDFIAKLLGGKDAKNAKGAPAAGDELPPGAVLVTLPFSMAGEGHELKIQRVGNELKAEMSSATLVDVNKALASAQAAAATNPDLKKRLQKPTKTAANFNLWMAQHATYEALVLPAHPYHAEVSERARTGLADLIQDLVEIGKEFGLKNLIDLGHPSQFVKDDEIKEEYRGKDVFRPTFYGGWPPHRDSWFSAELGKLKHEAQTDAKWASQLALRDPSERPKLFVVRDRKGQFPSSPYLDTVRPGNTPIDHIDEVSAHWNDEGHTLRQPQREAWYGKTTNWQILNKHENSAKSGPEYKWNVTINFRGPGEK